MRHYYTVKSHIKDKIFELADSDGIHQVCLEEINLSYPELLIGRQVSVSYLKPYIEIGVGARIED